MTCVSPAKKSCDTDGCLLSSPQHVRAANLVKEQTSWSALRWIAKNGDEYVNIEIAILTDADWAYEE